MGATTRSGGGRTGVGDLLLRGHRYMNLTTFRRSGEGVRTPVWFAEGASGGELYVYTMGDSGKAKRVHNDGRVLVGPSDRRGGALGPEGPAVARILPPAEEAAAEAALNRKYGLQKRAFGLVVRALGKTPRTASGNSGALGRPSSPRADPPGSVAARCGGCCWRGSCSGAVTWCSS